jgi:acetyl-CoA C-acetyltransferase
MRSTAVIDHSVSCSNLGAVTANVWILGGYQSDFARNLTREGADFANLTREIVDRTLAEAMIDAADIDVVHVGNAFGEMFAQQGHLGAMPATVHEGLWDTPATRHDAACASGSVAALAAMADLRASNYRTALVLGLELEKTVPGDLAAQHLGAAAWTGHEGQDAKYLWPFMFNQVADEYDRRYGIDDAHLRAIAAVNLANARRNPNAQTRDWRVPDLAADGGDDKINPRIEGRIRRFDCSQMTDGGAGVVLVGDEFLPDRTGRGLGAPHRGVGPAPETRSRRRKPLCDAPCPGRRAGGLRPGRGESRRHRRFRGTRLLYAQ